MIGVLPGLLEAGHHDGRILGPALCGQRLLKTKQRESICWQFDEIFAVHPLGVLWPLRLKIHRAERLPHRIVPIVGLVVVQRLSEGPCFLEVSDRPVPLLALSGK